MTQPEPLPEASPTSTFGTAAPDDDSPGQLHAWVDRVEPLSSAAAAAAKVTTRLFGAVIKAYLSQDRRAFDAALADLKEDRPDDARSGAISDTWIDFVHLDGVRFEINLILWPSSSPPPAATGVSSTSAV